MINVLTLWNTRKISIIHVSGLFESRMNTLGILMGMITKRWKKKTKNRWSASYLYQGDSTEGRSMNGCQSQLAAGVQPQDHKYRKERHFENLLAAFLVHKIVKRGTYVFHFFRGEAHLFAELVKWDELRVNSTQLLPDFGIFSFGTGCCWLFRSSHISVHCWRHLWMGYASTDGLYDSFLYSISLVFNVGRMMQ